jgi:UbiD family decarboxylase
MPLVRMIDLLSIFGDEVVKVRRATADYGASREIAKAGRSPILIEDVDQKGPVLSNLLTEKHRALKLLGFDDEERFFNAFLNSMKSHQALKELPLDNSGLIKWHSNDCGALPILKYYEKDAGRYVTSSVVLARWPDTALVNASIHRMLYLGDNKFALRMVEGRHLHQIYSKNKEMNKDTEVCVLIGALPHVLLAAATQISEDYSELEMAGSLMGKQLEVVYPDGSEIPSPAETEFLLKGKLRKDLSAREWMTDILGTYDIPRDQPVLEVEELYAKENPIYHAILPAGYEHKFLMGFPAEVKIREALKERGIVFKEINLTAGSGGWLHCVISIYKMRDIDGKEVIITALKAHKSLKGVVVVDEDIDPGVYEDVDFAFATRFQGDGVMFFRGVRGSSLDPSSDQEKLLTNKWGVDLTLPLGSSKARFEKARIP